MTSGNAPFTVFVTVGTDHHRFDRLVQWADAFATKHPDARVVVQHGSAGAPTAASGSALIPSEQMQMWLRTADAVVCHGGPATIVEIRDAGRLPIVVPRRSALGEHVDDHQVRFSSRVADLGRVVVPHTEAELIEVLEQVQADPAAFVVEAADSEVEATVKLLADLIDAVVG